MKSFLKSFFVIPKIAHLRFLRFLVWRLPLPSRRSPQKISFRISHVWPPGGRTWYMRLEKSHFLAYYRRPRWINGTVAALRLSPGLWERTERVSVYPIGLPGGCRRGSSPGCFACSSILIFFRGSVGKPIGCYGKAYRLVKKEFFLFITQFELKGVKWARRSRVGDIADFRRC